MKDIKQTEQKLNHWVKKSLSFVLLFLGSLAMGMTAFKTKPALEEAITSLNKEVLSLEKEVKTWKNSATTWMHRSNHFERKFYMERRKSINNDQIKAYELPKSKVEIKYVKEPITAKDSAIIYDIIYAKKIEEARKNISPIQVKQGIK